MMTGMNDGDCSLLRVAVVGDRRRLARFTVVDGDGVDWDYAWVG